jgi:putative transcriptional regulator
VTSHIDHLDEVQALNGLLAEYAAGTLGGPLHALVSAHLALKPDNRGFVRSLEALRAQEIDMVTPVALRRRDEMLARIFETNASVSPRASAGDSVVPEPIAALIGRDLSSVKWKTVLPGIRECRISDDRNGEASLLWIKPGKIMPSHTHGGSEVTLVLKGGFTDASGHYRRGDIAIADSDVDHRPKADDDEDCICFAVSEAPMRLTGPIARFFGRMTGH